MIMSNRAPLTSSVPASEQCSPAALRVIMSNRAETSQIQDLARQGCSEQGRVSAGRGGSVRLPM
jgi:hypothetical protein